MRQALTNNPDDTAAQLLLGAAFEKKGNIELADKQFAQAFDKADGGPAVSNAFARFLIRNERLGRAEQVLEASLSKFPENLDGLRLLATARLGLQNWAGAQEVARLIEERSDDDPAVQRIMGAAALASGDLASGITQLKEANARQPLQSQPLTTLVSAYIADGRSAEAEELLQDVIAQGPTDDSEAETDRLYNARILLARVAFADERVDDGESRLNQAIAFAPQRFTAYDLLYRYYLRTGRRDDAFALIYDGINQFEDNYGLKVLEADILLNERRFDEAIVIYEELNQRRPNDRLVANNYASLLADHRSDPESLSKAVKVAESIADVESPFFQDTVGWVYFKAGEPARAIRVFEDAIERAPLVAVLHYHLGAAYLSQGNTDDGRASLQRSLELGGENFRHADRVRELLNGT